MFSRVGRATLQAAGRGSLKSMRTNRAVIIGGGITGLTAAYRLTQRLSILGRPFEVLLLEATDRLGGAIATVPGEGYILEAGPDCFLSEKKRGVGLCEELGLRRDLRPTRSENRRSFILRGKKLYPVPDGFYLIAPSRLYPILMSPLLSLKGKLRLLKEFFIATGTNEDETLGSFVRRRLGPEVLERLAQPLAGGIYAADPDQLSLRATFPQFLEMEKRGSVIRALMGKDDEPAAQASGARYSLFVTLEKGMQTLTDRLAELIGPAVIRTGTQVTSLAKTALSEGFQGWRLTLSSGETLEADSVCLAGPAHNAARLLQGPQPALSKRLAEIPYSDSLTVHFAFPASNIKHPLNGFGVVVPTTEKRTITACTFVHRKFEGRAPKGIALLRAFTGGKNAQTLWPRSDAEVQEKMLVDLRAILGITGPPLFTYTSRYRASLPQYSVGHVSRVADIDEKLGQIPSLIIAGNWRSGVGIPDCIESGERAAEAMIIHLCKI